MLCKHQHLQFPSCSRSRSSVTGQSSITIFFFLNSLIRLVLLDLYAINNLIAYHRTFLLFFFQISAYVGLGLYVVDVNASCHVELLKLYNRVSFFPPLFSFGTSFLSFRIFLLFIFNFICLKLLRLLTTLCLYNFLNTSASLSKFVFCYPPTVLYWLQVMLWLDLDHGLLDYFPAIAINDKVWARGQLIFL